MALLDAYTTAAYYQARNSGGAAVGDATRLGEDLKAASRAFDFECGLSPGTINDVSGLTLYFDGHGGDLLRFRDERELLWLVRTIDTDGIGIDDEDDGTYDGHTLDLDDAWVVGWPANNAALSKPYEGLQLLTYLSTCAPSSWPKRKRAVRLNCTIGYDSIPDEVQAVICQATREVRDAAGAGALAAQERFGEDMPLSSDTWRRIRDLKAAYRRKLIVVA